MIKDPFVYIEHISACIDRIKEYTNGVDESRFLKDNLIQDAVIRNFEIIGEATKKLDEDFRIMYAHVEWKKIAGMRDKLIHDYIGVDIGLFGELLKTSFPYSIPIFDSQMKEILKKEKGL